MTRVTSTIIDVSRFSTRPAIHKNSMIKKHNHVQKTTRKIFFDIKKQNNSIFDCNKANEKNILHGLYGPLALVICILGSTCVTLIPAHNVITNPEFWYEIILPIIILGFAHAGMIVVRAQMIFDFGNRKTLKMLLDLCCTYTLVITLSFCLIHLVWTQILAFIEPFPFKCALTVSICVGCVHLRSWLILQKDQQMDSSLRRRQMNFIFYISWSLATAMQLFGARKIFDLMPLDFQWVLAVAVPILKEINDRIIVKLISKAASSDTTVIVKILGKLTNNAMFSFWIAVFLVTSATETTGYVLLGINFCLNLQLCYKAIRCSCLRMKRLQN